MNKDNEELLSFLDEEDEAQIESSHEQESWRVLIVDDEQEIHQITKMVLSDFEFDGRGIEFLSAFSEKEAKQILQDNQDLALVLLDVVMEKDNSGLNIVEYIRDHLKNQTIRIILRTGQPGQAPEKKVILNYDINDYKEKTELTTQKLFTTMVTALRAYRDLIVIENNKKGLEEIIKSSSTLFELQSMKKFASGVLTQLTSILNLNKNAIHCNCCAVTKGEDDIYILASTGEYTIEGNNRLKDVLPQKIYNRIENSFLAKKSDFFDNHLCYYFRSKTGMENVIYLEGSKTINEWDRYLIEIYCANVSVAFENIYLNEEIESTQKEIIFTLGEITETRSKETGYHVKRVAEYSKLLALKYGMSEEEAEVLRLASPMHDVGKVAIPDSILNKPGKLTTDEFEVMKNHSVLGYSMLNHANSNIFKAASIIALQHHEKYNGKGYPNGLQGEDIHIYGRITALADVFDALSSDRVYKKAWMLDEILDLIQKEKGQHFDPKLVQIFFDNLDEILKIKEQYSDKKVF